MASIVESRPTDIMPGQETPGGRASSPIRGVLIWTVVGCAALASSGVVRAIQDRRFEVEKGYLQECPFPLKSIPAEIEGWRIVEGGDKTLDQLTTRITGATDHFIRTYVDELTGVTLSVLVLFGPAEPVLPHTPQICYPSCGFTQVEDPTDRIIKGSDGQPSLFRTSVYAKSGGRMTIREVVYHSFRLEGPWSPDVAAGRKFPRKNPGIFKVQVQRRVAEGERHDRDDPIETFLSRLIPEIERRIAASQSTPSTASASIMGSAGGPTASPTAR